MIEWLLFVVLGIFLLASYLDIKYRAIPSVILTGTIFVVLLLRPENVLYGLASFVFALLIKDLISDIAGMEFGVADIKVFVIMGLLVSIFQDFVLMILIFLVFQFVYTVVWRIRVSKTDLMAFVPCLTVVYIALMLLGVVA